jgi:hypothetical protein
MGSGEVGGDGSVKWKFRGDNVRGGSVVSNGDGKRGHKQAAVDETRPGASFALTIELPKDEDARDTFVKSLCKQLKKRKLSKISVDLPIEDKKNGGPNPNQIRIKWPSKR